MFKNINIKTKLYILSAISFVSLLMTVVYDESKQKTEVVSKIHESLQEIIRLLIKI